MEEDEAETEGSCLPCQDSRYCPLFTLGRACCWTFFIVTFVHFFIFHARALLYISTSLIKARSRTHSPSWENQGMGSSDMRQ